MSASPPLKNARLEFRVTAEQKEAIEEAAAIEGRTVTDFSASALYERAQEVIDRERRLRVDAVRFDAFVKVMDRPARTVTGLRELLSRESVFVD
ncbi:MULTISPECIES: type II toxin-antitoxin system TacA family antitoxin [unclassified Microbacterium]|uniref:type II toxin-antitoxin system TacA family antitoxin n=1 Tax=unclassified Microbacterium TaxID=2609290 RepID=UPI00301631A2